MTGSTCTRKTRLQPEGGVAAAADRQPHGEDVKMRLAHLVFAAALASIVLFDTVGSVCCQADTSVLAGDDTLDLQVGTDVTAVLQAALLAAGASNAPGRPFEVRLPPGAFRCSAPLVWPANQRIRLIGAGESVTRLIWPNDLGTGACAISANGASRRPIEIRDITLQGPGKTNPAGQAANTGCAPARMSGIDATEGCDVENVRLDGFYAGAVVDGGHHTFERCAMTGDYYGLYWLKSPNSAECDDYVGLSDLSGNRFASVACAYDASISCLFLKDEFGSVPYDFYKEAAHPGGGALQPLISASTLDSCALGPVGNADFFDASGHAAIEHCSFRNCRGSGDFSGPHLPAAGGSTPKVGPALTVGSFDTNAIDAAGPIPGGICAKRLYSNVWSVKGLLQQYADGHASAPTGCTPGNVYDNVIEDGDTQRAVLEPASTTLSAGQLVEISSGSKGRVFTVAAASGRAPVAGISLTSAAPGGVAVIGTHGVFAVANRPAAPALALNSPVHLLPGGSIASGGSGVRVGYAAGRSAAQNAGREKVFFNSPEL